MSLSVDALGLAYHARARPQAVALIAGDERRTYGELAGRVNRLARALRAAGVGVGDAVGAALPNGCEWFELLNAVGLLGAQLVPIGYRLKGPEIAYMLADSGAKVLLAAAALAPEVDRAAAEIDWPDAHRWVVGAAERGRPYEAVLAAQDEAPLADAFVGGGFNTMIYTSGTTGRPKGIERAADPATAHLALFGMARMWGLGPGDVTLVAGPCYHTGPASYAQVHLLIGGTVVIMPHFDAAAALELIACHRVTNAFMVPTHFSRILQLAAAERARHDLSSVRLIMHSAAPCPAAVKRGILEVFPPGTVTEFYGASEGGFTRITAEEWLRKPGSVGTPWPGHEIHILDDAGRPLPRGEVGLIYVRAPGMQFRYRGAAEQTRAAFRDGMFTAGDLGWLDDDGYLFIADRRTDLVISGGANVYPAEVEGVLAAHPAVADVAVIGVPDPDLGKSVLAVVELRSGATATAEDLIAFCRRDLSHYKCPRRVELVASLPREPQGKVRKRELIERYARPPA
ncbi:AMP-binding protein [bacterium]|nr:AMP-binding protein [bacterium]